MLRPWFDHGSTILVLPWYTCHTRWQLYHDVDNHSPTTSLPQQYHAKRTAVQLPWSNHGRTMFSHSTVVGFTAVITAKETRNVITPKPWLSNRCRLNHGYHGYQKLAYHRSRAALVIVWCNISYIVAQFSWQLTVLSDGFFRTGTLRPTLCLLLRVGCRLFSHWL